MPFLFAAAIDTSCPAIAGGSRIDQMDRSGHYARWEEDLELARALGVDALWYGPPYYRTHLAPDHHDFECVEDGFERLRTLGIDVIAELCRFGVPSWLSGFGDPAFPVLFADHARAFARRFPWVRCYTPVSETLACATRSALTGEWNDAGEDDGAFVRVLRNLCMAHELAVEAILAERPDAVFVHRETLPAAPDGRPKNALRWRAVRPLALDLMLGHELPPGAGAFLQDHGVPSNDLSYFRERRADGRRWLSVTDAALDAAGRSELAAGCIERYGTPLLAAATRPAAGEAAAHVRAECERTLALRGSLARVHGFAWPALLDHVGWERGASVRANPLRADGLVTMDRERSRAGEEFAALARRWRPAFRVPLAAQR
jgi:hypothetical protein